MSLGKSAADQAEMLEKTPLVKKLSWKEFEELSKYMNAAIFPKCTATFEEGDKRAFMCVIFRGKVGILKENGDENKLITSISAGRIFREMSVIDVSPRSATARASEDTVLMVPTRQEFNGVLNEKPGMGAKILQKNSYCIKNFAKQQGCFQIILAYIKVLCSILYLLFACYYYSSKNR
jgi:CRP/FNR family transcriptional regulator, cyclic AMP receptor protein